MEGYNTSIKLNEKDIAQLIYDNSSARMSLTLIDTQRGRSKKFYRSGKNEESMRKELLYVSGLVKTIIQNPEIGENCKKFPVGRDPAFRQTWGLVA